MINLPGKEFSRFLRFALVGAFGAVVDFGVFNILTLTFHVSTLFSSIISFLVAVCSNFIWNRLWTYPDSRSKPIRHQVLQFLLISLIGLGIRTPLFSWLEPKLISFSASIQMPSWLSPVIVGHNIALALVIGVVMIWNFFANRFWTYNDVI